LAIVLFTVIMFWSIAKQRDIIAVIVYA
jgi:hypothetical protein